MSHCDDALRTIGQAIMAHQQDCPDQNPPCLEKLVDNPGLSPWLLVCPSSGVALGGSAYCYRGADLTAQAPAELILAYDKQPWHKGRRNVLFADGNVTRLPEPAFQKALARDNELRRQLGLTEKPA